jgi:hypothetical protein
VWKKCDGCVFWDVMNEEICFNTVFIILYGGVRGLADLHSTLLRRPFWVVMYIMEAKPHLRNCNNHIRTIRGLWSRGHCQVSSLFEAILEEAHPVSHALTPISPTQMPFTPYA